MNTSLKYMIIALAILCSRSVHAQNFSDRFDQNSYSTEFHNIYFQNDTIFTVGFGMPKNWPFKVYNAVNKFSTDGLLLSTEYFKGDSLNNQFPHYQNASLFRDDTLYTLGSGNESSLNFPAYISSFNDLSMNNIDTFIFKGKPTYNIQALVALTTLENSLYGLMFDRNSSNKTICTLVKFDTDLNLLDEIVLSNDMWDLDPRSIVADSDSTLIAGFYYRTNLEETETENYHTGIVRIDTFGNMLNEYIGTPRSNGVNNILTDGTYTYALDRQFIETINQFPYFKSRIVKLDEELNEVFSIEYGDKFTFCGLYKMIELKDGNFLSVGQNKYLAYMLKTRPNGDIIWEREFDIPPSSSYPDAFTENRLYDVIELPNNDIIACGSSIESFADSIPQQGLLIRTNPEGLITQVIEGPQVKNITSLEIFPNPTSDIIRLGTFVSPFEKYVIYSIDGQVVSEGIYDESIDVSFLSSGHYILTTADGKIGRFVKE